MSSENVNLPEAKAREEKNQGKRLVREIFKKQERGQHKKSLGSVPRQES